jgi:TolB protein
MRDRFLWKSKAGTISAVVCYCIALIAIGCGGGGVGGGSTTGSTTGGTTGSTTGGTTGATTGGTTGSTTGGTTGGSVPDYFYFSSDKDGLPELFKMNDDGSGLALVSTNSEQAEQPSASLDGTKITFTSVSLFARVFGILSNGTGFISLADTSDDNSDPSISPDGATVLFTSNRFGTPQLFSVPFAGGSATQLTFFASGAVQGQWSPDGTKITYVSGDTNDDVYIMNSDGTGQTQLTSSTSDEWNPAFSPDGSKIVFVRDYGSLGEVIGQIMVVNAVGGGLNRLTTSMLSDDEPCYSGNGQYIFFSRPFGFGKEIFRMTNSGGSSTNLTSFGAFSGQPRTPGL